jgi:hypothetical protein
MSEGVTNSKALHKDDGKIALQFILAMEGIDDVAEVGMYGAKKYSQWNYKAGMPWMKLLGSCSRHLIAFIRGENLDPESQLPHLAHLAYNALMLLDYTRNHNDKDDRYKDLSSSHDNLSS